jgi:hypothetical protein
MAPFNVRGKVQENGEVGVPAPDQDKMFSHGLPAPDSRLLRNRAGEQEKRLFLGRRVKSFGVRAKKQIRRDRRSVIWKSSLGDGMALNHHFQSGAQEAPRALQSAKQKRRLQEL